MSDSVVYTPVRPHEPSRPVTWMHPRRLLLLMLLSGGLFGFLWFYRQWTLFTRLWPTGVRPLLRTILQVVPIVDILLTQELIQKLQSEMDRKGISDKGPPGIWLALSLFAGWLFYLPFPLGEGFVLLGIILLTLIQGLLMMRYQASLNRYWDLESPQTNHTKQAWTTGERVVTGLGLFFWLMSLASLAESWLTAALPTV